MGAYRRITDPLDAPTTPAERQAMNTEGNDFSRLQELTTLCANNGAGWLLQYEDCETRWYLWIESAAPSECRTFGKFSTAKAAIDEAIAWINNGFKFDDVP